MVIDRTYAKDTANMHHKTITYREPRGKRERQKFTDTERTKMGL